VSPDVTVSSTFAFDDHAALDAAFADPTRVPVYTRYTNPTLAAAEARLAALENAAAALVFASGMAAISSAILAHAGQGQRVLAQLELYGGTLELLRAIAPRCGIAVDWFGAGDDAAFEAGIARRPSVVYLETPANPLLRCVDIRARSERARAAEAVTIVDSTFATPINQRPLECGADLVVHSATKYLGGHSDLIAGAVAGTRGAMAPLWKMRTLFGGVLAPGAAALLERSMRTLAVRMEAHNRNGLEVARYLERHPRVAAVHYPGLAAHPDHALARRQMSGFSGMVTLDLGGSLDRATRFAESLRLFRLAPSLGGAESLVSLPARTSHRSMAPEQRRQVGITDGTVRLSVGIEDAEDLIRDLEQALERAIDAAPAAARAHEGGRRG
jgi:cystathionine gamma-synthase